MEILIYGVAVAVGVIAFYLTKLLVVLGAVVALPMAAVGIWQGGPRLAERVRVGVGASLQSLLYAIPALYLMERYSSNSVPILWCYVLLVLFMSLQLVRLGYERFILIMLVQLPNEGREPLDQTRLLAGAVLWVVSAGILVFPLLFPGFRPSTGGMPMPVLYMLPFLPGWLYFSGDWFLSEMGGEPLAEPEPDYDAGRKRRYSPGDIGGSF